MNHLTPEQISEITAELGTVLRRLERSMHATEESLQPVELDQSAVGRLSRIDALQNQGLTRNLREREQAKLAQVVTALERLEGSEYGLCTECGVEIPFARLQVFPETPNCTACSPV